MFESEAQVLARAAIVSMPDDRASIAAYLDREATRLQRSRVQARVLRTMAGNVLAEMDREGS